MATRQAAGTTVRRSGQRIGDGVPIVDSRTSEAEIRSAPRQAARTAEGGDRDPPGGSGVGHEDRAPGDREINEDRGRDRPGERTAQGQRLRANTKGRHGRDQAGEARLGHFGRDRRFPLAWPHGDECDSCRTGHS